MEPTRTAGNGGRTLRSSGNGITEGGTQLGRSVAFRRLQLGLSQEELAELISTSPSLVARIEQGHPPSPAQLQRLTEVLSMEPEAGLLGPLRAQAGAAAGSLRAQAGTAAGTLRDRAGPAAKTLSGRAGTAAKSLRGRAGPAAQSMRGRAGPAAKSLRVGAGTAAASLGVRAGAAAAAVRKGAGKAGKALPAGRRRWALLAVAVLVPLLILLGSRAFGTSDSGPVPELVPTAAFTGVPAAVKDANQSALKAEARAQAVAERKAAERQAAAAERKREAAAAAAAPVDTSDEETVSEAPFVPAPAPPPAPSSGGGSSAPASPPDIQHGIGNGG